MLHSMEAPKLVQRGDARLLGQDSGLPDFPAITNYWNHIRIQVTSSESLLHPDDGQSVLRVVGTRDGDKRGSQAVSRAPGILTVWLRGIWYDTPVIEGTILRLIAPRRLDKDVSADIRIIPLASFTIHAL